MRLNTNPHNYIHIEHSKHTGKRLSKDKTSYPVLVFLLLLIGVVLVGLNHTVNADVNYTVTGRVAGYPPSEPANITAPISESHFISQVIPISGTCPVATIVDLYNNNMFAGSAFCTENGTFSINSQLYLGENELMTKVYNLGDTEGPDSSVVDVYLDNPPPQNNGSSSSSTTSSTSASSTTSTPPSNLNQPSYPLVISTPTSYQAALVGQTVTWKINITGVAPPYAVEVSWGDGTTSVYSESQPGVFYITHTYSQTGGFHGNYVVKLNAIDVKGDKAFLQLFILVNKPGAAVVKGVNNTKATIISSNSGILSKGSLKLVGTIYLILLLMTISFWLGEAKGIAEIKRRVGLHHIKSHPKHS